MIDMEKAMGFQEALETMLAHIFPLASQQVSLLAGNQRIIAADISARVDSPAVDTSRMDGYAVRSIDIADCTQDKPIKLTQVGTGMAGGRADQIITSGNTLRIMTGAPMPVGADAVVPEEFTTIQDGLILFHISIKPGDHILKQGNDVTRGQLLAKMGEEITPGLMGLLAAGGISELNIFRPPKVTLVATGDEVVLPGEAINKGQLYASNITALDGWCRRYGWETRTQCCSDETTALFEILNDAVKQTDIIITSGGSWNSERDRVIQTLEKLGWQPVFQGIRMSPGKSICFGLLNNRPVYVLPGGPSANFMGFLQIVLPALMKMAGCGSRGVPELRVRLATDLKGKQKKWTRFVFGKLEEHKQMSFHPLNIGSRLKSIAEADAIVAIPEGVKHLRAGATVAVKVLGYKL